MRDVFGADGALRGADRQVGDQRSDGRQRPAHRDPHDPQPAGLVGVVKVVLDQEPGSNTATQTSVAASKASTALRA